LFSLAKRNKCECSEANTRLNEAIFFVVVVALFIGEENGKVRNYNSHFILLFIVQVV
jgi:hypothetical protein